MKVICRRSSWCGVIQMPSQQAGLLARLEASEDVMTWRPSCSALLWRYTSIRDQLAHMAKDPAPQLVSDTKPPQ